MDNVIDIMSKFKTNLDSAIVDLKDKVSEIDKEEEFIASLGDVINYSKSDSSLLPFYDEKILSSVFERVFPLSTTEINKVKAAKYLIESSKSIDKKNFPQYNEAIKDIASINKKLVKFYDKILADDSLRKNKDDLNLKIQNYSAFYDNCTEEGFSRIIDNVDLFEEIVNLCDFSKDEINDLLNIAIKCNLSYLDSQGVIIDEVDDDIAHMKKQNDKFQDDISDLSNLLGDE